MLGEVAARSLVEGVLTDPGNQLLENGRALGVCDSVEVCLCSCDVRNVCGDRVRGRHLVLRVGPDLTVHREVRPFTHVPRGGCDSAGPLVFRERFLQPQVVPPRGRGEVSEPHVAHLVERRVRAALTLGERGRRARNVVLVEGDAARVFHRAQVVLGHVDLVVGPPRERDAVARMVEVESGAGHLEDIIGVEVTRKRTTAQESQRQVSMPAIRRATAPGASLDDRPRASNDRRDVAGERAGRREVMAERARLIHGLHACLNPVGGDNPARRCDDVECPFRLHIRLVNARPRAVGIVGLELGVEVNLAVLGIGVAVQAFTAARIARESADLKGDRLPYRQSANPHSVFVILERVRVTIEKHLGDIAHDVDEGALLVRRHRQRRGDGIGGNRRVLGGSNIDHDVDG